MARAVAAAGAVAAPPDAVFLQDAAVPLAMADFVAVNASGAIGCWPAWPAALAPSSPRLAAPVVPAPSLERPTFAAVIDAVAVVSLDALVVASRFTIRRRRFAAREFELLTLTAARAAVEPLRAVGVGADVAAHGASIGAVGSIVIAGVGAGSGTTSAGRPRRAIGKSRYMYGV